MADEIIETCRSFWLTIPGASEFWSAIAGAVVGGLIAYIVQVKALREGRRQREEDHRRRQQALGNSLLLKLIMINSNFYSAHMHFENSFEKAKRSGQNFEPWQIVLPLANVPDPIRFTSDEMGMLLSLKNYNVFNSILPMDTVHNSQNDALKALSVEREALTEQLKAHETDGSIISTTLDMDEMSVLRPKMILVNNLINDMRDTANKNFEESRVALVNLHKELRDKLEITYKIESSVKSNVPPSPERNQGSNNLSN